MSAMCERLGIEIPIVHARRRRGRRHRRIVALGWPKRGPCS